MFNTRSYHCVYTSITTHTVMYTCTTSDVYQPVVHTQALYTSTTQSMHIHYVYTYPLCIHKHNVDWVGQFPHWQCVAHLWSEWVKDLVNAARSHVKWTRFTTEGLRSSVLNCFTFGYRIKNNQVSTMSKQQTCQLYFNNVFGHLQVFRTFF